MPIGDLSALVLPGRLRRFPSALRRLAWANGRRGLGVILLYHRVAEPGRDPWQLAVSPRHFAEHLDVLRREANVLPLAELVVAVLERRRLDRAVAVTFDDGYADNLHHARPLLEHHDVPATVFVVSGAIGRQRLFWWDELTQLLLDSPTLPDRLELRLGNDIPRYVSTLPDPEHGGDEAERRLEILLEIHSLLKPLPEPQRQERLDQLAAAIGISSQRERVDDRAMSADEILALADGGLVEIGAHTVTHAPLARLDRATQRWEIAQSKVECEAVLGRPVMGFAYPYGNHHRGTSSLVAEAGFSCACTTVRDLVHRRTEPHRLPRLKVDDCDGETFARQLRQAFPPP